MTNLRPDLFRAVVAEVPFVDVINTMLDASLPLTTSEYEEWSSPILPRTNMDAGHGGASGRYDYLREIAFTYSFILGAVGIVR